MKEKLLAAFIAVRAGFSADRVVADPALNRRFLAECRRRGLVEEPAAINKALLNLRKNRNLGVVKSTRTTSFVNEGDYRFACEIAVRFIERRDAVSLDQIICDPTVAREFDDLAASIAPGFTALRYRWAALNLRKKRDLRPEIVARVVPSREIINRPISAYSRSELPAKPGLYMFFTSAQTLYVGESENLRHRLHKHLDHSDNKGLARWLWEHGHESVHLELHVLDSTVSARIRSALELELIRSRRPVFNVQGKSPG